MMTPSARPLRAAIYARISRDLVGSGAGVRRQTAECRELAGKHGWTVVEVFADNDISASKGARRKRYEEMLAAIDAGQVDVVVVWRTDRLYRKIPDLERYISICEPRGVPTHTVTSGKLDLTTSDGRGIARVLAAIHQMEVETKAERHKSANKQRALEGKHFGTRRCFGYEPDGLTIRKPEAEIIRKGVQLILDGGSIASVARLWNGAGFISPQGKRRTEAEKLAHAEAVEVALQTGAELPRLPPLQPSPWTATTVRTALRTPRLAGIKTYKGEQVRDPETGALLRAEWPPILDMETWDHLQRVLETIAQTKRFPSAERQLLSGLALCGVCGGVMNSGGTRNGRRRYRCRADGGHVYRDAPTVDYFVERAVLKRLKKPDARAALADVGPSVDAAAITRQLDDLNARSRELGEAHAAGLVTLDQVIAANKKAKQMRAELEAQLPVPSSPGLRAVLAADDIEEAWTQMGQDAKRAVIDALMVVEMLPTRTKERAYLDWRRRIINPESMRLTWRRAPRPGTP